jgi:hypothetical protein
MTIDVDEARGWAKKMVERESRGNGDQINALERVGRLCRMQPRSLRRLINGETVDLGVRNYSSIRTAYLTHTEKLISDLQAELLAEQAKPHTVDLIRIMVEVEALSAELKQRVEALNK